MGLPDENKSGYKASDVTTYCKDLSVPLLIIHGTADDNVYLSGLKRATSEASREASRKRGHHDGFRPIVSLQPQRSPA
jgi:hypothetical protein